jgi:hypothetical protein
MEKETYVDHVLNLAKDLSDGRADERNLLEDASFTDEDVEQGLVDSDELDNNSVKTNNTTKTITIK